MVLTPCQLGRINMNSQCSTSTSGHQNTRAGRAGPRSRSRHERAALFRTACRAILKKPPIDHPPQCRPALNRTAVVRSNCSTPAAMGCTEALMLAHGFSIDPMVAWCAPTERILVGLFYRPRQTMGQSTRVKRPPIEISGECDGPGRLPDLNYPRHRQPRAP
jgi:hypothetical protein